MQNDSPPRIELFLLKVVAIVAIQITDGACWLGEDLKLARSSVFLCKRKPAGDSPDRLIKLYFIYLPLRLLNVRLVPFTFDVPLDVSNSPVSLESTIFPTKLVS